jgi:DNA/RNA endonuclease YhcR with UshA esterase domain
MPRAKQGIHYVSIRIEDDSDLMSLLQEDRHRTRMTQSQLLTWYLSEYVSMRRGNAPLPSPVRSQTENVAHVVDDYSSTVFDQYKEDEG